MYDKIIESMYWLFTTGVPVLAAFILAAAAIVCTVLWRKVQPLVADIKMRQQLHQARATLAAKDDEILQLQQKVLEVQEETAVTAEKLSQARASLQSKLDEMESLTQLYDANLSTLKLLKNMHAEFLDGHEDRAANEAIHATTRRLAERLLRDSERQIIASATPNNYPTLSKRLGSVIAFVRESGVELSAEREQEMHSSLEEAFRQAVRREEERQQQAELRAQMREEQRTELERVREEKRREEQERVVQEALEEALQHKNAEHSAEVMALRKQLEEIQHEKERAKSQAQLTKCGHVYVISNIGSFGDNVFKVGMTRRLEPRERIAELGDASVPFPFDIHMMISCDNAPGLESALHKELHKNRINKMNFRKEFFRTDLETIRSIVEKHHGIVEYVKEPEAEQYRNSVVTSEQEYAFLSEVLAPVGVDHEEE
ncbi:MAG: GIY-YIG nuclease family protein [Candidatus Sumerlaeaceae bacterium]